MEMALVKWDPFSDLARVREDMGRMLDEFFGRRAWPAFWREEGLSPALDIYETDNEVVVKMEAPGVSKEDLDISLDENEIRVKGEVRKDEEVKESGYYRRERRYGSFSRSAALPARVVPDKAKATFRDGVLEVRVPKVEEEREKTRKVLIE